MNNLHRNSLGGRNVEQAIMAIKRGSYLLKYGRRGKPTFCPFRLSTDETRLIWYYGKEEKTLQLSRVSTIIHGQRTAIFHRHPWPGKEYQSFSLIHDKGSLDLICKDKDEAEIWFIALRTLISPDNFEKWRSETRRHSTSSDSSSALTQQSAQSVLSTGSGNNFANEDPWINLDQHPFESPPQTRLVRALSDILLYNAADASSSYKDVFSNSITSISFKNSEDDNGRSSVDTFRVSFSSAVSSSSQRSLGNSDTDILIWGEGTGDDLLGGVLHSGGNLPGACASRDSILPKTLESASLLDTQIIACGSRHAVLITKHGETFSWGDGSFGRLGHGIESDINNPKLIDTLSGLNVTSAACGEYHTCVMTIDGELYTWGDGTCNFCLLGHGTGVNHWTPKKVRGSLEDKHVSMVSCGPWHSAVLTSVGQLFTFGDGSFGALGHGDHCNICIPREVESLKGLRTTKVSCGYWHTAAVVESSLENLDSGHTLTCRLFTWGNGDDGQLGHGDNASRLVPCCVTELDDTNFCQVACGCSITVALTTSGQIYTMGSADHGQLGVPGSSGILPSSVHGKITNSFIEEIACGSFHVAALSSQSEVYTWGKGGNGQLGHGENYDRSIPTQVEALRDKCVKSVVCGKNFTVVICLHKELSIADYSICSGCHSPFNFRRKRHNCYNCGLAFCKTCTNKKSVKASLAPRMHKPYRVCDDCFTKLNKGLDSSPPSLPPKACGLLSYKSFGEQREKHINNKTKGLASGPSSFVSFRWSENQHSRKYQKQDLSVGHASNGSSHCDGSFVSSPTSDYSDKMHLLVPGLTDHFQLGSHASITSSHTPSFSKACSSLLLENPGVLAKESDANQSLTKELSILREQVEALANKSQFLEVQLETALKQLTEAQEAARVETGKNIAAKEVIQSLVAQLKSMTARSPRNLSSSKISDPLIDETSNTKHLFCVD